MQICTPSWPAVYIVASIALIGCPAAPLEESIHNNDDSPVDAANDVLVDGGGASQADSEELDAALDGEPRDGQNVEPGDVSGEGPDGSADAAVPDTEDTASEDAGDDRGSFVLYLAPDGDDQRDGRSLQTALLTLARAQEVLEAEAPERDVEILIAPGRYHGQTVEWRYTMANHQIRFARLSDDSPRPIFDGCLVEHPTDPQAQCPGGTWLTLRHTGGEATNLVFHYIQVERYQTAISLNGNRNDEAASNGHNRIYGCFFKDIGNVFAPNLSPSTAAVRLVNSDDNEIANNHFVNIINTTSGGLIHAIYAAHMSDRNKILRNRFKNNSGDAVRLRDFSNDNEIRDNRFIQAGLVAGYTDWYCDHDARNDCTKPTPECPSWGNQFRDNLLDGNYHCEALGTWHYFQDDDTTGCAPPAPDARRVRTSGNVRPTPPCSTE